MPRETSRYGWYVVSVLLGVYMVHHLDRMVVTLLLDPIGREFQLSDSHLGLLAGLAYAIPFALLMIFKSDFLFLRYYIRNRFHNRLGLIQRIFMHWRNHGIQT